MSKMGEQVEKAMLDLQSDLEEEYYGVGDCTGVAGTTIDINDSTAPATTGIVHIPNTTVDNTVVGPYWSAATDQIVIDGAGSSFANQTVVSIGPMSISASEDGEVEVVLDDGETREEYHFSAKTMRGLLRKLADVVVEGRET